MGTIVSLAFIAMKLFPFVPGHFTGAEWIVLLLWIVLGFLAYITGAKQAVGHSLKAAEKSTTE
jgi:hypothetical protein